MFDIIQIDEINKTETAVDRAETLEDANRRCRELKEVISEKGAIYYMARRVDEAAVRREQAQERSQAKDMVFERKGDKTRVLFGGEYIGLIERRVVSNSSPRGGAYRTMHYAYLPGATRPKAVACYSRKEAADWLRNRHNEAK